MQSGIRAASACGLSSGSASRLVSMAAPARVRSAYGDLAKAAAGGSSPWSRALTRAATEMTVEVQDDMARFDSVDRDLGGRDAAKRGCGHGYVGGQRLRRQYLPQLPPLLVDVTVGREG